MDWWGPSAVLAAGALHRMQWYTLVRCAALLDSNWRSKVRRVARLRRKRALERGRSKLLRQYLPAMWAAWAYRYECSACRGPMSRVTQGDPPIWACVSGELEQTLCNNCYIARGSPEDHYFPISCMYSPETACADPHWPPHPDHAVCMVPSKVPPQYDVHRLVLAASETNLARMMQHWIKILCDCDVEFAVNQLLPSERNWDSVIVKQPPDVEVLDEYRERRTVRLQRFERLIGSILDWVPVAWVQVGDFDSPWPPQRSSNVYDTNRTIIVLQCCNPAHKPLYGTLQYFYNGYWYVSKYPLQRYLLTVGMDHSWWLTNSENSDDDGDNNIEDNDNRSWEQERVV